jgi:hypothetical protein
MKLCNNFLDHTVKFWYHIYCVHYSFYGLHGKVTSVVFSLYPSKSYAGKVKNNEEDKKFIFVLAIYYAFFKKQKLII